MFIIYYQKQTKPQITLIEPVPINTSNKISPVLSFNWRLKKNS